MAMGHPTMVVGQRMKEAAQALDQALGQALESTTPM
jgi:hypothetical protein